MSEIIPPLISNTPPPPPCLDEEEDDEFGNFIGSNDLSYGCESNVCNNLLSTKKLPLNFQIFRCLLHQNTRQRQCQFQTN